MMLQQAVILLSDTGAQEAFVVNNEGTVIGWINKVEFIKALARQDIQEIEVQDIMDFEWISLPCAMTIKQLEQEFEIYRYHCFLVVDTENYPIGILRPIDVEYYKEELCKAYGGKYTFDNIIR